MTTSSGQAAVVNKTSVKEQFCVKQELFDFKTILNKVDTRNVSEPDIPTKSSTEILSELFGSFNAEPPKIAECVEQISENGHDVAGRKSAEKDTSLRNKRSKKSKKKHKQKEKKHKKKTKSSKRQGNSEDSDDTGCGGRRHKDPSEGKKKKKLKDSGVTEPKLMPTMEPVSIKITTDGSKNVKRTVACSPADPNGSRAPPLSLPAASEEPVVEPPGHAASSQVAETNAKAGIPPAATQPKQLTSDMKPRSGPGRIVIKNLKYSSVYEETVRQVEEQAKLKAERYEEGELSEDSSDNKEASPTDDDLVALSPEHSTSSDRKDQHRHCRKHTTTDDKHYHRHHHHSHHHRSRSRSHEKSKRSHSSSSHDRHHSHGCSKRMHSRESSSSRERLRRRRSHSSSSRKRARRSRSHSRHRSPGHIDKQKLLEIARKNAMTLLKQGVLPSSVVSQDKMVAIKAGGKSVAELTDFCKQLSKKEALGQASSESEGEEHPSSGSDTERPFHHPFQIKERPASIVMNIRNSVQLPVKTLQEKTAEQSKQLRIQFPVSSGQQHRKSENEWVPVSPKKEEPTASVVATEVTENRVVMEAVNQVFPSAMVTEELDIGAIVSQRLTAMRKLQENPNDVQAISEMYRAQKGMQMWAESKQQPGQFTGTTGARVLTAAELASGYQAWAKKVHKAMGPLTVCVFWDQSVTVQEELARKCLVNALCG
ncbi:hypothetical protein B7P43_G06082, partial [Cryptotermes secundus]